MYDNSDKLGFTPDRSKHPSRRPRTPARATFRQSFGARGPRHAQHAPKALSAAPGGHASTGGDGYMLAQPSATLPAHLPGVPCPPITHARWAELARIRADASDSHRHAPQPSLLPRPIQPCSPTLPTHLLPHHPWAVGGDLLTDVLPAIGHRTLPPLPRGPLPPIGCAPVPAPLAEVEAEEVVIAGGGGCGVVGADGAHDPEIGYTTSARGACLSSRQSSPGTPPRYRPCCGSQMAAPNRATLRLSCRRDGSRAAVADRRRNNCASARPRAHADKCSRGGGVLPYSLRLRGGDETRPWRSGRAVGGRLRSL